MILPAMQSLAGVYSMTESICSKLIINHIHSGWHLLLSLAGFHGGWLLGSQCASLACFGADPA